MKTRMVALCCLLALGCADKKADELEGNWILSSTDVNGVANKFLNSTKSKQYVKFQSGRMVMEQDGIKQHVGPYTADASRPLKIFDVIAAEGPEKGKTLKFIYAIDGDTLKICGGANADSPRPEELSGAKDTGQILFILKRER